MHEFVGQENFVLKYRLSDDVEFVFKDSKSLQSTVNVFSEESRGVACWPSICDRRDRKKLQRSYCFSSGFVEGTSRCVSFLESI